jgi:hypothetical protein
VVPPLTAGDGADDKEGFLSGGDSLRQRGIRRFMGEVSLAGEESDKRPALLSTVIADRPAQHGITRLQRVEDGTLCHRSGDLELYLLVDAGQRTQVKWNDDSDH